MKILCCNPYLNAFYIGASWDEYYKYVEKYITEEERESSDSNIDFYRNEYHERAKGFYEDIKRYYNCDKVYDLYFVAKRDLTKVYSEYVNTPYFPYGKRKGWRLCKHFDIEALEELKLIPMIAVPHFKYVDVHEEDYEVINNYVVEVENEQQIIEYKESNRYVSYYEKNKKHVEVIIEKGNVALFDVDAVVNAANSSLFPGSGVCGAIFSNAGYKELYEECMKIGGCETGSAVITNGYNLKASYIIHTVGPIYENDEVSAHLLKSAYLSTLELADGYSLKEIAIPSISTGIYGYPKDKALDIALDVVLNFEAKILQKVILVCYDDLTYDMYVKELEKSKNNLNS